MSGNLLGITTMSANTSDGDRFPTAGVEAQAFERLDGIRTDDGELIVYDRDREAAWIQSDHSRSLETMR